MHGVQNDVAKHSIEIKKMVHFTSDSKFVISAQLHSLEVFVAATGELFRKIKVCDPNETNTLIGFATNPFKADQVYTCTTANIVQLWDLDKTICLEQFTCSSPMRAIVANPLVEGEVYGVGCVVPKDQPNGPRFAIFRVTLYGATKGTKVLVRCAPKMKHGIIHPHPSLPFLAYVCGSNLILHNVNDANWRWTYEHSHVIKCVCFHPSKQRIAFGDALGHINLMLSLDPIKPGTRSGLVNLRWHAHAVSVIAFTPDASLLLSGGEEGVLVLWQENSGSKNFLPRLGGALDGLAVSPDASSYAVLPREQSMRVIDGCSLRILRAVGTPLILKAGKMKPVVFQSRGVVAVSTEGGILQFIDPFKQQVVSEVDVVPRNVVTRHDVAHMPLLSLDFVCFSSCGEHMCTLDVHSGESSYVPCLRFWKHTGLPAKPWSMTTRIDHSHNLKITALKYHPTSDIVVSASADGTFKVWVLSTNVTTTPSGEDVTTMAWRCANKREYHGLACNDVAFSEDGSVLCASFAPNSLTLWNTESGELIRELCFPLPIPNQVQDHSPIGAIHFIPRTPMLLVVYKDYIVVWNLLRMEIEWGMHILAISGGISVDPLGSGEFCISFALSDTEYGFAIFDAHESTPRSLHRTRGKQFPLYCQRKSLGPDGELRSALVLYNPLLGFRDTSGDSDHLQPNMAMSDATAPAAFGVGQFAPLSTRVTFPTVVEQELAKDLARSVLVRAKMGDITSLLDAPSHAMPSVHNLFDPVLTHLLASSRPPNQQHREAEKSSTKETANANGVQKDTEELPSTTNDESQSRPAVLKAKEHNSFHSILRECAVFATCVGHVQSADKKRKLAGDDDDDNNKQQNAATVGEQNQAQNDQNTTAENATPRKRKHRKSDAHTA